MTETKKERKSLQNAHDPARPSTQTSGHESIVPVAHDCREAVLSRVQRRSGQHMEHKHLEQASSNRRCIKIELHLPAQFAPFAIGGRILDPPAQPSRTSRSGLAAGASRFLSDGASPFSSITQVIKSALYENQDATHMPNSPRVRRVWKRHGGLTVMRQYRASYHNLPFLFSPPETDSNGTRCKM